MKKFFKRTLAFFLAVVMVVGAAPLAGFVGLELPNIAEFFNIKAEATSYSGTCGADLTWTLDADTGILEISGTGDMFNYTQSEWSPWINSAIKSISVEKGVTSIGDWAFWEIDCLTKITIPDTVKYIGKEAFFGCSSLENITIPDGITTISPATFRDCSKLSNIIIPDSVINIGSYAFEDCEALNNISIGNNVITIGAHAFANCTMLANVVIGNSVEVIGDHAFHGTSLTSITIPGSVTSIGWGAFYECSMLEDVAIPNSVVSIGSVAFNGCSKLESIKIPDTVLSIGYEVFDNTALYNDNNNWKNEMLYIGNHLVKVNNTISGKVVIKSGTKTIAGRAFYKCTELSSIIIGDGVTCIESRAFYGCTGITSITIPKSVTNIKNEAFDRCTGITDVYYNGTKSNWEEIDMGGWNITLTNATIHFGESKKSLSLSDSEVYSFGNCDTNFITSKDKAYWISDSDFNKLISYAKYLYSDSNEIINELQDDRTELGVALVTVWQLQLFWTRQVRLR